MPRKNRLKPRPENRKALQQLEIIGLLYREKFDLRNIIRADSGKIEYCGHNFNGEADFIKHEPCLRHFDLAGDWVSRSIQFNGRHARILAMTDRRGSQSAESSLGTTLPVNALATELMKEPCRTLEIFFPDRTMYGDAVMISDNRMHWVFCPSHLREGSLQDFAAMLTTPWEMHPCKWYPKLIFLEEPSLPDIMLMKLKWG